MIRPRISVIVTLSLALVISAAEAQQRGGAPGAGSVRIKVQDVSGHVHHAHGRLAGPGGGSAVETDAAGALVLSDLALGHYTLTLTDPGFAAQVIEFDVRSSEPLTRDVTLAPGSVSTSLLSKTLAEGADRC
jgi:hypothetical protein